jgi:hypothetical protein
MNNPMKIGKNWWARQDLNLQPPGPELGLNLPKPLSWPHSRFSGRFQSDKFGQVFTLHHLDIAIPTGPP